ncbi:hypothetical protein NAEGRDRAFT_88227 [Naegleria gruberi]|uniref:Origin recognition complex subunit 2 n=1 Tax=Naegleria gruberi TaxID=5762 RepID=D2V808_NAEGR|nr:uncharacterized protein NAEGRDRAFT_88227 [Naegleria gruberi]EFC46961.1 hypothetical protein NAEGRDRAFT_88227 [Naegleria gruberi]|eukprot:XP_002679705.1 hypothetical protein NAEGRDRAFT_88227 [Naegleria gruberi strain NEG-M]
MYCMKESDVNSFFAIVCGYNPEITIGIMLDDILKTHLKEKNTKNLSYVEKVDTIIRIMNQRNELAKPLPDDEFGDFAEFMKDEEPSTKHAKQHLYICIHNIDGPGLRSKSTQHLLSVLSSNRYIHLICSVDNQLSNLLWEPSIEDKFGFMRFNITNFCTYFAESEYYSLQDLYNESSDGKKSSEEKSLGPVEIVANILKSANKKHRQIYMIICNKFIENEKYNESEEGSSQPKPSGSTHQEIKSSMGVYSTDDALLRDGLSYLENQIKVIKKKQNTFIPTLKRNQCEKLLVILNNS